MCRNIKTLHNFAPPATREEVQASALQFVRKISGFSKPAQVNQHAFDHAVVAVSDAVQELLDSLITPAAPHDRAAESARARARSVKRFGITSHRHRHALPAGQNV